MLQEGEMVMILFIGILAASVTITFCIMRYINPETTKDLGDLVCDIAESVTENIDFDTGE